MNDMRYLASVVTTCFTSFGELLALHKRFAELSGGVVRCFTLSLISSPLLDCSRSQRQLRVPLVAGLSASCQRTLLKAFSRSSLPVKG